MSSYLSRIEGSPPKRNVAGSIPVGDATNSAESLDFTGFSAFFNLLLSISDLAIEISVVPIMPYHH